MQLGPGYLEEALKVLSDMGGTASERLKIAGRLFWKGMILLEPWPDALQERSAAMLRRLLESGAIGRGDLVIGEGEASVACEALRAFIRMYLRDAASDGDGPIRP